MTEDLGLNTVVFISPAGRALPSQAAWLRASDTSIAFTHIVPQMQGKAIQHSSLELETWSFMEAIFPELSRCVMDVLKVGH